MTDVERIQEMYDFVCSRYIGEGEYYERLWTRLLESHDELLRLEKEVTEYCFKLKELQGGKNGMCE